MSRSRHLVRLGNLVIAVGLLAATTGSAMAACGDGVLNAGEQCDDGSAVNGTTPSCCSALCQFKAVGTACRGPSGTNAACQQNALCTGTSSICPANPNKPNGTSCNDGQFCNGTDTCQTGVCTHSGDPCAATSVCSPSFKACFANGCPAGPAAGCRTAAKSILLIKNKEPDDSKDKLLWKWITGASVDVSQLGDPTIDANYALCIYSTALAAAMDIKPNATTWAAAGTKGYKYGDDLGTEEGLLKGTLKSSDDNKSKALFKGAGANLPDPIDTGPLMLPVKVQLINHRNGVCMESTFTSALSNDSGLFKATAP